MKYNLWARKKELLHVFKPFFIEIIYVDLADHIKLEQEHALYIKFVWKIIFNNYVISTKWNIYFEIIFDLYVDYCIMPILYY